MGNNAIWFAQFLMWKGKIYDMLANVKIEHAWVKTRIPDILLLNNNFMLPISVCVVVGLNNNNNNNERRDA